MNYWVGIFSLCILSAFSIAPTSSTDLYTINFQEAWHDLESNKERQKQFGGKWIWAGTITFVKKAKTSIHLSHLCLRWNGTYIPALTASLYKPRQDKKCIPIQEYFIADAQWIPSTQTLLFTFDTKQMLGAVTEFYLVLTVAEKTETALKSGAFVLEKTCLPVQFQHYLETEQLAFSLMPL